MLNLQIRAATEHDAVSISALATYVFLDTYATEGIQPNLAHEVFSGYSAEVFKTRLNAVNGNTFDIAENNGYLVGFVEVNPSAKPPLNDLEPASEITMLYVQPGFQKKGVGKALLDVAERRTLSNKKQQIWLTAWEGNTNALGFYQHSGFKQIGSVDHIIDAHAYKNWVLTKRLGPVRNDASG